MIGQTTTCVSPDIAVSLDDAASSTKSTTPTSSKKKPLASASRPKKPKNMPKRPLSGYNLFFQAERQKLMIEVKADQSTYELKKKQHKRTSGVGFAGLARKIAQKWKSLGEKEREPYEIIAREDRRRYHQEIKAWKSQKEDIMKSSQQGQGSKEHLLPPEGAYSSISPRMPSPMLEMRPSQQAADPSFVSHRRLSLLNSSTRQTRLLLQQMIKQREAASFHAMVARTSPAMSMANKPLHHMSSLHHPVAGHPLLPLSMQRARPVTPDHPRKTPSSTLYNTISSIELPTLQTQDSLDTTMDQLEALVPATQDWDDLVEQISGEEDAAVAAEINPPEEEDYPTLDAMWGDICNI